VLDVLGCPEKRRSDNPVFIYISTIARDSRDVGAEGSKMTKQICAYTRRNEARRVSDQ